MMFRLIKQIINKQNKVLWLLLFSISLVMSSIISVSVATKVYIDELQHAKEKVYGAFTHIIYNPKHDAIEDHSKSFGVINILNDVNDNDIVYGQMNHLAITLGKINMPSLVDNEVAITEEIAQKYHLKEKDLWHYNGKEWRIKTIIDNIGLLWIKGTTEESPIFKMPNIIVSDNHFQKLDSQSSGIRRVWLANFNVGETTDVWNNIPGNHYRNTFLESNTEDYHTPEYILNLISIIFFIILMIMLRTYIVSVRKRYHIYKLLGMVKWNLKKLFFFEFLTFNILTITLGLLLSVLIASLFLSVALKKIYIIDSHYYWGYFLKYIMMYAVTLIISLLLFTVSSNKPQSKKQVFLRQKMPFDLKKIGLFFNIGLFSMLIVFLIGNLFLDFNAINTAVSSSNAVGKIVNDSDYELILMSPANKLNKLYYDGNYHDISQTDFKETYHIQYHKSDGELESIQQQLLNNFPNAQLESYVNLSEIYLMNKNNLFQQDYLQKLYSSIIIKDRPFWNSLLNQSNDLLLVKTSAYPDDKLKLLSPHFSGDLQSVLKGESVYLIAPAYEYFESFDPVNNVTFKESKPIDKTNPNAVYDDKIKEDSLLSLIALHSKSSVYGRVDSQFAKKRFTIKQFNVPVGGIAFKQVGWLDRSDITTPYRLIVSKAFLDKHDLDKSITRIRVKIPNLDYNKDDKIIRQIIAKYPNVKIIDQYDQLKTFRQYSFIQQGFKILLIIIFFVLTTVIFNSLIQANLLEQYQKYLVYGLLGMSRKQFIKSLYIPVVSGMILSTIAITLLELHLFFGRINILSAKDFMSLFTYIVLPMIICMLMALMFIYHHIKKFLNNI